MENSREFGGQGRNRTTDTLIFSQLLYQLSYLAEYEGAALKRAGGGVKGVQDPGRSSSVHGFRRHVAVRGVGAAAEEELLHLASRKACAPWVHGGQPDSR